MENSPLSLSPGAVWTRVFFDKFDDVWHDVFAGGSFDFFEARRCFAHDILEPLAMNR